MRLAQLSQLSTFLKYISVMDFPVKRVLNSFPVCRSEKGDISIERTALKFSIRIER